MVWLIEPKKVAVSSGEELLNVVNVLALNDNCTAAIVVEPALAGLDILGCARDATEKSSLVEGFRAFRTN